MANANDPALIVLILGMVIALSMLLKAFLDRTPLPALVGYIGLGFGLSLTHQSWGFPSANDREIFLFLGDAGLVVLLFRVGLESNLRRLMSELGRASLVAICEICISGFVAYAACRWLLSMSLPQSLIVAAALTATSVSVAVSLWQGAGMLGTRAGALLVDVAEMDDIAGVVILGLVLALAPGLHAGQVRLQALEVVLALSLAKLALFAAVCLAFARYMERPLLAFLRRWEAPENLILTAISLGFMLAALASMLGLSLAIGAFFAGLMFSRDPRASGLDRVYSPIHELLSPFFFISIGMRVDPSALSAAGAATLVLLAAAVLGKLVGSGVPVWLMEGRQAAMLVGASMVPRAEITLIIMQMGQGLGDWAVSGAIFAAVVLTSVLTCILGALSVKALLARATSRPGPGIP